MEIYQTPIKLWEFIRIDWIVKLPLLEEPVTTTKYNSILIIVNQLIKFAHFLLYKELLLAE